MAKRVSFVPGDHGIWARLTNASNLSVTVVEEFHQLVESVDVVKVRV